MNIVLFVNKDLESNFACHLLREELANHRVRIYYSEKVGKAVEKPAELVQLQFFEREFVYGTVLNILREHRMTTPFVFFGEGSGIPMTRCDDVNDSTFIDTLRDFHPDIFLSIRFGHIFHEEVIGIPAKGVVNLHSAILPRYRGILGTLHALKERCKEIGCTLHYIGNRTIDTGDIIDLATMGVDTSRSLFWHVMQLYVKGCLSIVRCLQLLSQGGQPMVSKQEGEGHYFSSPTREDFAQLRRSGFSVITADDYLEFFDQWVSPVLSKRLSIQKEIIELRETSSR